MIGMTEVIKNKNNIIPIVGVTIGVLTLAAVGTAVFFPPLFGVLVGMGLTPALLGVIAAFALAFVFTSVQQIITNTAVENARGKDGVDGLSASNIVAKYMLNNHDKLRIKNGTVVKGENELQLNLSIADYKMFTEGMTEGDVVLLHISLCNPTTKAIKEVEVAFTHVALPDDQDKPFSVALTLVNGKSTVEDMNAELDFNAGYLNKVALCDRSIKSLINEEMVSSAMQDPIIKAVVFNLTR